MSELVKNVLDLMRFESGPIALRRDWQTLDDLAGSAIARVEDRLRGRSVSVDIPADVPPVYVDADLIVQTFVNLLDNVAKYTPAGAPVRISAQADDERVLITVDDEGPGLPTSDRNQLFDKFQRGRDEGTVVGAGLGLAICLAVIQAHGGNIWAGDRPGGGARFQFTVPAKEPAT
jgi:two-component system sensor histidine kinase KdpD